ncbi:diacylglycerol kinase family lipid kinase [Salipaludibacillus sp. LMS25]|jgi:YegS/Rv2252/BmrU family lipid kinase|uniref:diacylglycerol/lipid kinase family protein n=1 Tax=Salipaludibacillus sp. LMS25 TaxID=2924031 RepID=UPI0020D04200|nr:diacylglycerol kinase family protein [Salipaludibacillus sp. LMS25]UTR14734.1 diacylglycerol kinase family lipid kinase [Salipaludibacillus sp. LMS25]
MLGFIVNESSGNGRGRRVWKKVEKSVLLKHIDYTVRLTSGPNHATTLVRELLNEKVEVIIVVGGDGTIHEVVNGLAFQPISLGIIPTGSGNDFARSLSIPMNPFKALERILSNDPKSVDILDLGKRYCLTVTGIGLDGQVAATANKAVYKRFLNWCRLGSLSYTVSLINTLIRYAPTTVRLVIDGNEMRFEKVWLVAIANAPSYGGGITICPDALYNDGLLNVCVVHGLSRWAFLRVFPKAFKGNHIILKKNVTLIHGKHISVLSDPPVPVHTDGEQLMLSPVEVTIKEEALKIV